MRRLLLVFCLLALAAAAFAPAALADSSTTQTVGPGGTVSTGADATPGDPVQMSITAPQGGTFTIDRIDSPQRPTDNGLDNDAWVGPQYRVTLPSDGDQASQQLTVTFRMDKSVIPLPGNVRNGHTTRDASAGVCFDNPGTPVYTICHGPATKGDDKVSGRVLPDGDVEVTITGEHYGAYQDPHVTFNASHAPWEVEAFIHDQDLDKALSKGLYIGLGCVLLCIQHDTVTVSHAVAHKLHLKSTTVGRGTIDGATGYIPLSHAFRAKLRRYKRVVVTVALDLTSEPGFDYTWTAHRQVTLENKSELG